MYLVVKISFARWIVIKKINIHKGKKVSLWNFFQFIFVIQKRKQMSSSPINAYLSKYLKRVNRTERRKEV